MQTVSEYFNVPFGEFSSGNCPVDNAISYMENDIPREDLAEGRDHLTISGTFQSDKYQWCPAGFVPIKITDPMAYFVLHDYAKNRSSLDVEFHRDLTEALYNHGRTKK